MNWLSIARRLAVAVGLAVAVSSPALASTNSGTGAGGSQAYEAELPADLATAKDMCALLPCKDVFPGAASFSERKGQPPYVEAYGADGKTKLGYVMLSTDITDTPAYSGKPVVTLIGMDNEGKFVGVKVLKHSEPILLLGIPESALINFNNQYIGKSVKDKIEVGSSHADSEVIGVDAISGATVTVIAQNQVLMTSGAAIAKQVGIMEQTIRPQPQYVPLAEGAQLPDWNTLVKQEAVRRIVVQPQQVGLDKTGEPFIELWFGSLNSPIVGQAVLGKSNWQNLMSQLKPEETAIFVIRTAGKESFKGSGFVRGGIYDRVQVRQDGDTFTFRDTDALNLYSVAAKGAPTFTEAAIFMVRSKAFSDAYPWQLTFLGNKVDRETGTRTFANFDTAYWMPAQYLEGGHPKIIKPDPSWLKVWKSRALEISLFALLLVAVTVVYALRDPLTRRSTHKNKWPVNAFKYSFWMIFIVWVGFIMMAQPSITQVLTWLHSLLFKWEWTLFLSDPFIFLFWVFIFITIFVFGRGLFCGWTCPFGSIQEIIHKVAGAVGLKRFQFQLPQVWHDRLKWVKYAVFFGLVVVSLFSMGLAEKLSEVEPFKTTFLVGLTNRSWPYVTFVAVIFGISIFIERPYCKYVCPLGASLAMPSTFRWFGLKRKADCNSCKACAKGCGAQAIDADGRIDHRECLHCLDCMILYTDTSGCPPLAKERKMREREGQPLTAIGKNGYFIPIVPIKDDRQLQHAAALLAKKPDPRLPTDVAVPPVAEARGIKRLWVEIVDHLWPFNRDSWKGSRILTAVGIALALAASLVWVLAAQGSASPIMVIGWWFGWSVFEVLIRLQGKRYVKDGPWWGTVYRRANVMDMLAYVGFKNLLIGAALFWALQAAGLMTMG
ncbi:NosR/NirI family protein [Brachymonas denitrificans]|uniref:NosR/NirI family transcriptional regulator, nitrous oxide reductase regulator n=1 Tax=Brachymonas denitrificans DSM 15123 TaxID=1121117 RepID=A0A1H8ESX2_9BURK|nr:NosR/NirI family protein [Brachymonas denitrificans]SEN22490.1 NosR/NirI family transcriptional regulator, nitrous oxide reductase regulator [Brachymonas denitrificans DSM 15123]